MADRIYFLPVTPWFVEKVIEKEKPDGIMLAFGGQTALNCGIALHRSGVLEKHRVSVLGTPVQAIIDTEDRELFAAKLGEIGVKTPRSIAVSGIQEAAEAAGELGYPVIVRSAYALGGLGSGENRQGQQQQQPAYLLIHESKNKAVIIQTYAIHKSGNGINNRKGHHEHFSLRSNF